MFTKDELRDIALVTLTAKNKERNAQHASSVGSRQYMDHKERADRFNALAEKAMKLHKETHSAFDN